jgi:arylsulfatase A-like enzyme
MARAKPPFVRYVANLATIDKQLGQIFAAVERLGLEDRTYFIVSSDHGEAFGEHDTFKHNTTLYEELVRVPLMIRGPKIKARAIETPVSVIDLGPTILDLFAQPIPGHMMGESLIGFLRGKNPELTRPIGAEGRLKKSLLFPDGFKAIVDDREGTAEVFDLRADPDELINLLDVDAKAARRIEVVRKFFSVHRIQREGYTPPYRR